jgi:hypothetical protein
VGAEGTDAVVAEGGTGVIAQKGASSWLTFRTRPHILSLQSSLPLYSTSFATPSVLPTGHASPLRKRRPLRWQLVEKLVAAAGSDENQ